MHKHAKVGSIVRMVFTRLLNFVSSKLVIYQNGKVICKRVSIRFLNFVRSKLVIYQSGKVVSKRFHLKTIFKTKCYFMWCRNISTRVLSYRFHQMSCYCKTWCFGSVGLVQNIFSKVFTQKYFHKQNNGF